jgi:hypothetical protein
MTHKAAKLENIIINWQTHKNQGLGDKTLLQVWITILLQAHQH